MTSAEPPKWKQISWLKKDEQFARIPEEWRLKEFPAANVTNLLDVPRKCGIMTEEELRITEEFDATALAAEIRERRLRCIDVARAFCKVCCMLFVPYNVPIRNSVF